MRFYHIFLTFLLFSMAGCNWELISDKTLKTCVKPVGITITPNTSNPLAIQVSLNGTTTDVKTVSWQAVSGNQSVTATGTSSALSLPSGGTYSITATFTTSCEETSSFSSSYTATVRTCTNPTGLAVTTPNSSQPLQINLVLQGNTSDVSRITWRVANSNNVDVPVTYNADGTGSATLPAYGAYSAFATIVNACGQTLSPLTTTYTVTLPTPEMVYIPGGGYEMGNNGGEGDEKPVHTVIISDFNMSKYEITVRQYRDFCTLTNRAFPEPPSWGWIDTHPMVLITYADALAYCVWLSQQTGKKYRLPTEAEWEFAARGGRQTQGYIYAGSNNPDLVAWHSMNSGNKTNPVGTKNSNEFGLFDMSGNVYEYCSDWYGSDYYSVSPSSNPQGPTTGDSYVVRGGSWVYDIRLLRTTDRNIICISCPRNHVGFRVVREN